MNSTQALSYTWKWLRRLLKIMGYSLLIFVIWLVLIFSNRTMMDWLFAKPVIFIGDSYTAYEKWQLGEDGYNYKHYYKPVEITLHGKVFDIPKGHIALGTMAAFYKMYPTGETPNSVHLVAKLPELAKDLENTRYWSPEDKTKNVDFFIKIDENFQEFTLKPEWKAFPGPYGFQEYVVDEEFRKNNNRTYRTFAGYSSSGKLHRIGCEGKNEQPIQKFQECNGSFLLQKGIKVDYHFSTKYLPDWQNIAKQLEELTLSFYNEEKTKQLQQSLTKPQKGN